MANKRLFAEWHKRMITNKEGHAKPLLANVMTVLRDEPIFQSALAFDVLREETMVVSELPWNGTFRGARPWRDNDDRWLAEWLQNNHLHVPINTAAEAVQAVAAERSYHPILDYMKPLVWSGDDRLDEWPIRYLGCPDTPYVRAVGARWMISAVARVMQPGCKADCALVLEGKQGKLKSTALRTIATPWFTDEIAALGTKDAAEQTIGVWIVELAELEAVTRAADVAHVKAFISRQTDRFRMSYGRRVGEHPRQCVFAATCNDPHWNRDPTGGRRWWPLATGQIDIDGLIEMRDQLWAEARDRYISGEAWWLNSPTLLEAAELEQFARSTEDPISQSIEDLLSDQTRTTTAELMSSMSYTKDRQTKAEAMRIGAILRSIGWERRRFRDGNSVSWEYHNPKAFIK